MQIERNFLKGKHIPGAMMVARCGDILNITVPSLLQWTDWVLLLRDNTDAHTEEIVSELKRRYGDRIRIADSGFPPATHEQETKPRGLLRRFKPLQGPIRQKVLDFMWDVHRNERPIDMFIWPDSDEIFSKNFPKLLKLFADSPDKMGISMKPVDVYGDMNTILGRSMTGHTRVLKLFDGLSCIPHRAACYYNGLNKQNRLGSSYTSIHLAGLTEAKRQWRNSHWKPNTKPQSPVWRLKKPVYEHLPEEIRAELGRAPDMTAEEYIRGGDKRVPVGVENAALALREASDLLDEMGIRHYLAFGTALGIYRDKELIKWDWDIDLIVLGEDLHKFNPGMLPDKDFTGLKVKRDIPRKIWERAESGENYIRTISFVKYSTRIDLDPAYLSADGKSRIILKGRKRNKFSATHPKEWFESDTYEEYRGKEYRIPSPQKDYLESNYGPNWDKPVYGPMPWHLRPCLARNFECAEGVDFGMLCKRRKR